MTSPVPPPAEDADRILLVDDDATNLAALDDPSAEISLTPIE